jgi:tRNA1Val (adenine37-N6)-methyltransferase
MANSYFRFKQFTIQQGHCAMKVTTDACLFGGWVAQHLVSINTNKPTLQILDIGTGTGLLPLMLVQQMPSATIHAVEIDLQAANQAQQNLAASNWSSQLQVFNTNIKDYITTKQYDVVISNPPFYEQQLASNSTTKNLAHHSTQLPLHLLLKIASGHLKNGGLCYVLLPYYRLAEALHIAQQHALYLHTEIPIKQTTIHPFFRVVLCFCKQIKTQNILSKPLSIELTKGIYSPEFISLLQPYYLYL